MDSILRSTPVIPVSTIRRIEQAVPLADALVKGGLVVLEVALRSSIATQAIQKIREALPQAIAGLGYRANVRRISNCGVHGRTGRASAFGSKPAPTIKLATNNRLFRSMSEDMDINRGDILSAGASHADKGDKILDSVLATASGKRTKSETLGFGDKEFFPWQIGAVM